MNEKFALLTYLFAVGVRAGSVPSATRSHYLIHAPCQTNLSPFSGTFPGIRGYCNAYRPAVRVSSPKPRHRAR